MNRLLLSVFIGLLCTTSSLHSAEQTEADRIRQENWDKMKQRNKEKQVQGLVQQETDAALRQIQAEMTRQGIKRATTPELRPDTPTDVRDFINTVLSYRERNIAACKNHLRQQVTASVQARQSLKGSKTSPEADQAKEKVDEAKRWMITVLSDPLANLPYLPDAQLQTGMIGKMKYNFKIHQVLGSGKLLGGRFWSVARREIRSTGGAFTKDSTYETVRPDDHTDLVILKGRTTGGLADGQSIKVDELLKVTGTETYTSVSGASRTVLVLEPFDLKQFIKQ